MNSLTNLIAHSAKHQCHYTKSRAGEHLVESEKLIKIIFWLRIIYLVRTQNFPKN